MRLSILPALATLLGHGCGLGPFTDSTSEGGGSDNLPTAGIGPYGKLPVDFDTPADEPYVVADSAGDVVAPTALARDDGGFRIWYERRVAGQGGEIWAIEIPGLTELPDVAAHLVLAATEQWEAGDVREPCVIEGGDDELILYYEAGDPPAIGRAVSTDGGATFVREPEPVLAGASAPGAALHAGVTYLFYERNDRRNLFVSIDSDDSDGVSFALGSTPVLQVAQDDVAFDRARVERPALLVRETVAGRLRFDLFYQGRTDRRIDGEPESALGYAGGFDLAALSRPFPPGEPILDASSPFETSPAVVLEPDRGVLFFTERRGVRARIGAATDP